MTKQVARLEKCLRVSSLLFDELCRLGQIFDCQIQPDVERIQPLDFENKATIFYCVCDDCQIGAENKEIKLEINIQASDHYPQDYPLVKLASESLSEIEINELSHALVLRIYRLCGGCMLEDIMIFIEDWIKENVFKTHQLFMNEFPENSVIYGQETEEISDLEVDISHDHCFSSLIKGGKFLDLSTSTDTKEKFSLDTCIYHHCGVCYTHAVRTCDNSAYFVKIWKISMESFESDDSKKQVKNSLFGLMDEIKSVQNIIHDNICFKSGVYVSMMTDFAYFLIATPLSLQYGHPLCSSLESLWLKVSEKTVYLIIKQILEALNYLHRHKIVHHNVYPCNIKILSFPRIILCDHGHVDKIWDFWSRNQHIDKKVKDQIDLHHFKMFSNFFTNDFAGDVFQYGLIVLSLCECKIYSSYPIRIPQIVNEKLESFITKCLESDKKRRYTTHQLLQHPYMANYRPSELTWMGTERDSSDIFNDHRSVSPCMDADSRLMKEFELIKVIGKGAFGVVALAKNKIDSCIYAIKRITLNKRDWNERGKIMKEVQIMSRLSHPNIVRYYNSWLERKNISWYGDNDGNLSSQDSFCSSNSEDTSTIIEFRSSAPSNCLAVEYCYSHKEDEKSDYPGIIYIYIQMEYCENKSLEYAIEFDKLYLNEERLWQFFREICSGLSYLHSQGMIHRDIKPQNILITSLDHAKIVDFNLAIRGRHLKHIPGSHSSSQHDQTNAKFTSVSRVGTAPYIAPEIEEATDDKVNITSKVDMYSFGIVFFEMCHPRFTTKMEKYKVISKIKTHMHVPFIKDRKKLGIIRSLIVSNPKVRLSADDLLMSDLCPVSLEDNNLDKVFHYLSSAPFSTHARKILQIFFTHDEKLCLKDSYLDHFYSSPADSSILSSFSSSCVEKYLNNFFKKRCCLYTKPPLFFPYHQKNVFVINPSLCFVDHQGVRVTLSTSYLTHLFEWISKQSYDDLNILPITRFGGIYESVSPEKPQSSICHPLMESEVFYAVVCTSKNLIVFLTDVIIETYNMVTLFKYREAYEDIEGGCTQDIYDMAYESNLVQRIELHLNHLPLIWAILGLIGLKKEDQTMLLNRLSDLYNTENEKLRMSKLDDFFTKQSKYRRFKSILMFLFSFQGTMAQLEEKFLLLFRVKFNLQVKEHVMKVNSLIQSIALYNTEIHIKLTPYLFNSPISQPDSFIYRFVGFQEMPNHPNRTVTLSCGGIFRYHLEYVKHHGYIAVGNDSTQHDACNHEFLVTKDLRIAFSSTSYDKLVSLHNFMHFCRSCTTLNTYTLSHDVILICYRFEEKNFFDFTKLHSLALCLREEPNFFPVYVYNHSLTYESIRCNRDKFLLLNVSSVLCVDPDDFSIKIFDVDKEASDEVCVNTIEEVLIHLNKLTFKHLSMDHQQAKSYQSTLNRLRNVQFMYFENYSNKLKKKYQKMCFCQLKPFYRYFNNNIPLIILIFDVPQDEYENIISSYLFLDPSTKNMNIPTKFQTLRDDMLKVIRENVDKEQGAIHFLFNIRINKLMPIF